MQGTIAQIVALVVQGNAYIRSADQAVAFPAAHSTLAFCEFVKFVDLRRSGAGLSETAFAADPASWIEKLRQNEVQSIRMAYMPSGETQTGPTDRMLVGFVGGGGHWLLKTAGPKGSDYWEGRWVVGDQNRSDRKIWQVTYGRIAVNQPSQLGPPADLESLKRRLVKNLKEISAFARHHNLDGFAKAFEAGLSHLESSSPGNGLHHNDMLSSRMPLTAAQLLSAAQSAWVFGGMGSWNDLGFEGNEQRKYDNLSEELYRLLNDSIVAAANSTASNDGSLPHAKVGRRPWWRPWA
ncbi:hypothetical protein [Rudaea cellulosilytica]|uniref:hypothetical protein n=1 Tax=Rudaea cellulosilytica TaxID=540746 RepID=UPI0012FA8BE3|nr:hypothetical protein [Rudaea cellulosilytica]